jgi:hypothetical protein
MILATKADKASWGKYMTIWFRAIAMFAVALGAASAQTTTGSITGSLVDPTGAAIPNATITVTDEGRQNTVSGKTDETGRFAFTTLQPGRYTLEAQSTGFRTLKRENVTLLANDRLTLGDIRLELGEVGQTVEVSAQAVALKTESAERSDVLVTKQLENIAVNGRSYLALAALTPGVVSTGNFQQAGTAGLGRTSFRSTASATSIPATTATSSQPSVSIPCRSTAS